MAGLSYALDREDFACDLGEDGGGITGPAPISKTFSPARNASGSHHEGNDVVLGDRLPCTD